MTHSTPNSTRWRERSPVPHLEIATALKKLAAGGPLKLRMITNQNCLSHERILKLITRAQWINSICFKF